MNVIVNGENHGLAPDLTITGLLGELGLADKKGAVELNQSVVDKTAWSSTQLHEDDRLEIVHFVGGG